MLPRRAVVLYYCYGLFFIIQLTTSSRLPIKSGNFRRYSWVVKDSPESAQRSIIFETGDDLNADKPYSQVSFRDPSNSIETEDDSKADDYESQLDTDSIRFQPLQKPLQADKNKHRRRYPSRWEITNRGGGSNDFLVKTKDGQEQSEPDPAPSRDDISFNGSEDELFSAFFAHVKTNSPPSTPRPSVLPPIFIPERLTLGDSIADRSSSSESQSNSVESKNDGDDDKYDDAVSFLTLDSGIKGRSCETGHVFKHGRCRSKVSLTADSD